MDKNAARKFSLNIGMKFENALEKEALRTKAQQTQIKMNIFVEVIKFDLSLLSFCSQRFLF